MSVAGSGYLPRRFGEKFLTDIARWNEFGEDHFQIMCMVSEIFETPEKGVFKNKNILYQKFCSSSKRRMFDANFKAPTAAIYMYMHVLWDLIRR